MRINKRLGLVLLSIWLIITGLVGLLGFGFAGLGTILALLAIIAGILLIFGR